MAAEVPSAFHSSDIAALSASAVAAAVSVFLTPGPFGWVSLIVSATLIIIILASYWGKGRRWWESLAVAAAIALSCIPGVGFFLETSPPRAQVSTVEESSLALAWFVLLVLITVADILLQRTQRLSIPSNRP